MLDIQFIRDNAGFVQEKSRQKNVNVDIARLLQLDEQRRTLVTESEGLRAQRNQLAAETKGHAPDEAIQAKGRDLKEQLARIEAQLQTVEAEFQQLLLKVPNMPTDDTPVGSTEDENQVTKTVGTPREFTFKPKSDEEMGKAHGFIDKDRAAKVAGSRFTYIRGKAVRLQFALISWVMDVLSNEDILKQIITVNNLKVSSKPFIPVLPPPMIRTDVYEATARLKAEEVTYKLSDDELWLNGSAEHSLAPMYQNEILDEVELPIRYLGYATSFRREAGSYGKDMEGIFRLHHFDKLEMESFSTPESSLQEHLFMVAIQEYLVARLGLPYQVILKCTADIGDPNARGVDINVWMPAQGAYRETHSADYITDYQTRRLKTRLRRADGQLDLVHTNDATAFAMGRTIKAIMENLQTEDGDFDIPEVLQHYMGGQA